MKIKKPTWGVNFWWEQWQIEYLGVNDGLTLLYSFSDDTRKTANSPAKESMWKGWRLLTQLAM